MANKKLTKDELKSLTELQQKNAALVTELGSIELVNIGLEERRENAEKFLLELREEEKELAKKLEDKYGQGSINLDAGEFIAAPAAEAPAEEVPVEEPAE